MSKPIATKGNVTFNSVFFDPRGTFQSELTYPTMTAKLNLSVSRGMNAWQVEEIELVWNPPPAPAPTPAAQATPNPTPTPEPKQERRKRKGGEALP